MEQMYGCIFESRILFNNKGFKLCVYNFDMSEMVLAVPCSKKNKDDIALLEVVEIESIHPPPPHRQHIRKSEELPQVRVCTK